MIAFPPGRLLAALAGWLRFAERLLFSVRCPKLQVKTMDRKTLERVFLLVSAIEFRKRLKILLPDVDDPPDLKRVAAELCARVGLQPSEFRKLNDKERTAFVDAAIRKSASMEPAKKAIKPARSVSVNARMVDEMGRNPDSHDWSARRWAKHLRAYPRTPAVRQAVMANWR